MLKPQVKMRVSLAAERSANVLQSFTAVSSGGAASAASSRSLASASASPDEPALPELLPPVLVVELLHAAIARFAARTRKGTASAFRMAPIVADARGVG